MSTVLVTGGSGFIGSHAVLRLLADGHAVRTTVRNMDRASGVRSTLRQQGVEPGPRLAFVEADLGRDAGWTDAVRGCDYVLHVASPFPVKLPPDPEQLIVPAREGTLRVLRAARDAGVRRVVITSSIAAVAYGHPPQDAPFDERTWTNLDGPDVRPYVRSKTLAERAAWDFAAREGGGLELVAVNPSLVCGPVLGPDYSTSVIMIRRMLEGTLPGCPRLWFGIVDVRDVADLHVLAMTHPAATGERFIATAGDVMSVREIADVLRSRLGHAARRVPTRVLPDWTVRLAGKIDSSVAQVAAEVGRRKNVTSAKASRLLGWVPRSREDALVATAESLLALGLVRA